MNKQAGIDTSRQGFTPLETVQSHGKAGNLRKSLTGFTIIELMIATMVFSVILLLITFGMLQIGRTYYKGVTMARTQNTARSVLDQITQAIQFSGGDITPTPETLPPGVHSAFCIGDKRYSYILDRELTDGTPDANQAKHVLVVDTRSDCHPGTEYSSDNPNGPLPLSDPAFNLDDPIHGLANPVELLGPNMRLAKLVICEPKDPDKATTDCPNPPLAGSNLYQITISIVYGDTDLLNNDLADPNYHKRCGSFSAGTQFCAFSELSTTVQKRL